MPIPTTGDMIPDFTMPASGGQTISSAGLKGKPFVLYFYPKDDTSGCTAEACDFRDNLAIFNTLGVPVVGVSRDSVVSHEKFIKKHGLTFPLASDEDGHVCEAFGVWVEKSMYGRKYMGIERTTFLIDGAGRIVHVWKKVSVGGHVAEVAAAAKDL